MGDGWKLEAMMFGHDAVALRKQYTYVVYMALSLMGIFTPMDIFSSGMILLLRNIAYLENAFLPDAKWQPDIGKQQ